MYYNSDIKKTSDYVIGSIKDLKEYFRYEIASQCTTGSECDYENFSDNVRKIMELLDNLYEDTLNGIYSDNDIVKVSEHPMNSFIIESEWENE